ncbi:MAG: hypothetical protein U1E87_06205 [Alphaproteobacteria bacterium]
MSSLRNAFRTISQDPKLAALLNSPQRQQGRHRPRYLNLQIANYKAGLARLSSGSSDITALL